MPLPALVRRADQLPPQRAIVARMPLHRAGLSLASGGMVDPRERVRKTRGTRGRQINPPATFQLPQQPQGRAFLPAPVGRAHCCRSHNPSQCQRLASP
jgi:hypothetical protein